MTGTDVARFTHKSVTVVFEPPCIMYFLIYFCLQKPFSHGVPFIFPKIFLTQINKLLLFHFLRPMIKHHRPQGSYCCLIKTYS